MGPVTVAKSRWIFAPLAGLIVLAGYFGLRLGQPVSETDIITHYAQIYVADVGDGAALTDCLATTSPREDVRLIVICTHPEGAVFEYPAGPRGQLRAVAGIEGAV